MARLLLILTIAVAVCLLPGRPAGATDHVYITIGTGGVSGVYYPAGGAIARLVNKGRKAHGLRATVQSTGGSVSNLRAIRFGKLDFGVAQSDLQFHAFSGSGVFAQDGPDKGLRALFSLHAEPFTVIARADSGISSLREMKGKRVNIGNLGSGQRATMEVVMEAMGWTAADFKQLTELQADEQATALCNNDIDAMVYTVGHPNNSIKAAAAGCDVRLVNVEDEKIDELLAQNRYYKKVIIPSGMYQGTDVDIHTFGVAATLVASARVPETIIYDLVRAVFENFFEFRKMHPAFVTLKKQEMVKEGLSAPLHQGARRYFIEAGLL